MFVASWSVRRRPFSGFRLQGCQNVKIDTLNNVKFKKYLFLKKTKKDQSISFYIIKMNTYNSFRTINRILFTNILKRHKGYKVVKRPDITRLKMPSIENAPSIMDIIKEKIRLNGPLTVAEYMHIVVTNPTSGYYMKQDAIGQTGDFITSPEISQLFGEILAIWFCAETQKMDIGKPLQIVELGPGNGTLLIDILRVSMYCNCSQCEIYYLNF